MDMQTIAGICAILAVAFAVVCVLSALMLSSRISRTEDE